MEMEVLKGGDEWSILISHPPNTRLELKEGPLEIWDEREKRWKEVE